MNHTRKIRKMGQHAVQLTISRHNRWYEKLLLNPLLGHTVAISTLVLGSQFLAYQSLPEDRNQLATLMILFFIYVANTFLGSQIAKFPGGKAPGYSLTVTMTIIGTILTLVLVARTGYARTSLVIGVALIFFIKYFAYLISKRFRHLKLAVVPYGITQKDTTSSNIHWRTLVSPSFQGCRFDGVIVDMDTDLPPEWVRFISHASISGIPVINARKVQEELGGKVDLDTLRTSDLESLQPSPAYLSMKRVIDTVVVIALSPLIIPVCLMVALLVKLDSKGPILFVQKRVGQGNRVFSMYKFRSMREESLSAEPRFADTDSHRITKFGSIIRKYRLDELPQLFNVLKGDMSLIGPRPEQSGFVEQFEKDVPFYSYRHIVHPGITGWAQVSHGYAVCTESTKEKVEHDFYYIKNLSIGLDVLIIFKTIKTILTGFGAK